MSYAAQPPPQRLALDLSRMPTRRAAHRRKPAAPRLSSESYFQAAFEILAESGADGVTAANMCDRLGVTKGSFYYHFYSMPEFVEAFVDHWERGWQILIDDYARESDLLRRMGLVVTAVINASHEAEAALRAWGHSNPVVADAQARVDQKAEALTSAIIAPFVPPDHLDVHVDQLMCLSIGMPHRQRPVDRRALERAMLNLIEMICPHLEAHVIEAAGGRSIRFREKAQDKPDNSG